MAFLNDAYILPHEGDVIDYIKVEYGRSNTATIYFTNGKTVIVHIYRPDVCENDCHDAEDNSKKGE